MLRSVLASLVLVVLSVTPLASGCGKQQKLTEVKVPDAGVSMRYDLAPGQEYKGHVGVRNSVQTPVGDVVTRLEFDVVLLVSDKDEGGAKLVRAVVNAIELELRLPEGVPAGAVGGLTPESAKALNGTELRFNLSDRGEVSNEPEPPEGAPMEVKAIIGMITSGLTSSFVRVPAQPVKDGEQWDDKPTKTRAGVTSAKYTGKLRGLGRNAAGEDIAQLEFTAAIEADREGQKISAKHDGKAAFSTTGGYPSSVKRTVNNEVVGQGSLLSEIEATWTKGAKQAIETTAPPSGDVQAITDPCDPDYVGAEACAADGAAPAGAPQ
ncbi:MAG: hypothetical protein IAG13_11765 [Deltaproteobacteria bacterium]|nr:hypothetical protein [Nannocystaceae bacterium]